MRNILLTAAVTAALLAGCRQSADTPASTKNVQVLPITGVNATMMDMPGMMQSMQGKPMKHDAALQRMHERHDGMEQIGKSFKVAGRSLKSGTTDLGVIRSSAATLARLSAKSSAWFPAGTGPDIGKTRAKPEIWQRPADFVAKDREFQQAAAAFNAAARSGDMAAVQARFDDLGKTCKACHDTYRSEEK